MRTIRDEDKPRSHATETFGGCRALRATALALLVRFEDGKEYWVPQSQIDDDSEVYEAGGEGKLVVSHWWADKQGLL
jgi:hypothetical protein